MPSAHDEQFRAILHVAYSSKPTATLQYNTNRRKLVRTLDGCDTGVLYGKAKQDAALLLLGHHDPEGTKCEILRTLILTVQTPPRPTLAQLHYIDDQIERAFYDLKKFLGAKQMAGHIHGNTQSRHAHITLPNSNGQRGLQWDPKFLSTLQDFGWTTAFQSGRGKGVGKSLNCYPYARHKEPIRALASQLLDEQGKVFSLRWDHLVASGVITDFRLRKDGSVISFAHGGKRFRLKELQDFVSYRQSQITTQQKENPMPISAINPTQPIPSSLQQKMLPTGLTTTDLQQINVKLAAMAKSIEAERVAKQSQRQQEKGLIK
jgi:hypothetical protein